MILSILFERFYRYYSTNSYQLLWWCTFPQLVQPNQLVYRMVRFMHSYATIYHFPTTTLSTAPGQNCSQLCRWWATLFLFCFYRQRKTNRQNETTNSHLPPNWISQYLQDSEPVLGCRSMRNIHTIMVDWSPPYFKTILSAYFIVIYVDTIVQDTQPSNPRSQAQRQLSLRPQTTKPSIPHTSICSLVLPYHKVLI